MSDRRVPRLTPGFQRARRALGIVTGSSKARAVAATTSALAAADELPGREDFVARFGPGRAFIRRVPKQNLWIWYRVDDVFLTFITITNAPPVPEDDLEE